MENGSNGHSSVTTGCIGILVGLIYLMDAYVSLRVLQLRMYEEPQYKTVRPQH
jgi:hypothetical protein